MTRLLSSPETRPVWEQMKCGPECLFTPYCLEVLVSSHKRLLSNFFLFSFVCVCVCVCLCVCVCVCVCVCTPTTFTANRGGATVVQEVEKTFSNQKVVSSIPCRSVLEQDTEPLIAPDVQCAISVNVKMCIHPCKSHICKSLWIKASAK